jgi:hypothetical protein
MDIKNSKSILAKLMAQENITVVHAKAPTASFDTKSRTLTLPIWTDMTGDLYDLLCGHEVGHALETPEQGWHDAIVPDGDYKKIDHALKGYLNVLEDARIEKKIKNRYPGLRVNFYRAYQGLYEKNFFGTAGKNLSEYGLIDRINLHFKLGSFIAVPFSEEEKSVVRRVENLSTWEEVEALARELLARAKSDLNEQQDQIRQKLKIRIGAGEMDDPFEEPDFDDDLDVDDIEYEFDADMPEQLTDAEQEILNKIQPEAETDQAFRDNENRLLDKTSRAYEYLTLADIKADPFIIGYKKVLAQFVSPKHGWCESQLAYLAPSLAKFKLKNEKFVNYLVKEFELKRNAAQQARAKISKSGEIDVKKVFSYRYNEDLFRRFTSLPNGKNHGLLVFFDMSGSMTSQMSGAIEQMLVLVEFCRKVNIPFEVYGFSNLDPQHDELYGHKLHVRQEPVVGEVHINDHHFTLRQYFSDGMRPAEYKTQMANMATLARVWDRRHHRWNQTTTDDIPRHVPTSEELNGTPLNQAIMLSIDIFEKFIKRTKAEIVNMAFLTDGETDGQLSVVSSVREHDGVRRAFSTSYTSPPEKFNCILTHKSTKKNVQIQPGDKRGTQSLVKLVREVTSANVVCFDIMGSASRGVIGSKIFKHENWNDPVIYHEIEKLQKAFRKDKLAVVDTMGFNEYYLIPGGGDLSIDDDELDVEAGADKKKLMKAFTSNQNDKKTNRILLNRFIRMIA